MHILVLDNKAIKDVVMKLVQTSQLFKTIWPQFDNCQLNRNEQNVITVKSRFY